MVLTTIISTEINLFTGYIDNDSQMGSQVHSELDPARLVVYLPLHAQHAQVE